MARNVALFFEKHARFMEPLQARVKTDWSFVVWRTSDGTERLCELVANATAILSGPGGGHSSPPWPQGALQQATQLKLCQVLTAGYDWLDLEEVPHSAAVCNTSSMDPAIAEYVVAGLLEWQIGIARQSATMREGKPWRPPFNPPAAPFHGELGNKTLGIIGYGKIGCQVARRAHAFDMRLVAVTGRPKASCPELLDWCGSGDEDLERLLRESDFVVLTCALTAETRGLLNAKRLGMMKSSAVIINIGRGGLCEEEDLFNALKTNVVAGAVLDVWWSYPSAEVPETQPSRFPFHTLPNVVMTPHISGWTAEQEERKMDQLAHNLDAAAGLAELQYVIKAPQTK